MINHPPSESARVSWLIAAAWTLSIYYTVFRARELQAYVAEHWGRGSFTYAVYVAVAIGIGAALVCLLNLRNARRIGGIAWLIGIGAVYAVWTHHLGRKSPEEAMHFVQYGILALFLYRALVHHVRDPLVYLCAWLLGSSLGAVDEIIQWMAPRRFFDHKDILLNSSSCALALAAVGFGLRPAYLSSRIRSRSVALGFWLGILVWVLLFATWMNTPGLQAAVEERIPAVQPLLVHTKPMVEYGYRHHHDDTGTFKSRLTEDQLRATDRERGAEVAAILDAYHAPERYGAFLDDYPSHRDPFAHEARVHLFRRDRYRHSSGKYIVEDPPEYSRHMLVAFRENRILERYFSNTLSRSKFQLRPETISAMEASMTQGVPYQSGVSYRVLTGVSRKGMAGMLLGVLLAWVGVNGYLWAGAERGRCHENDPRSS